ncbi:L-tyrosine/L-tryptophan isonitrile synthase family protein [Sulfidibacter corallicola]|uniref:L-tyrosine/L-tryptophan isonitrile synthase family protein n=1 Tax=Sulfidibacter corallicola TaxID=2818388 RepID=A0A8A4TQ85_SULCO|nr:L-tyrosine/L-tryptophan isonitrile synthase family protein [Sulfidibacter corallicola]QTD51703.1 L-tyrosine/L-tryptophan isonitrile synthase family protein [Sulfidibacter corallicola]
MTPETQQCLREAISSTLAFARAEPAPWSERIRDWREITLTSDEVLWHQNRPADMLGFLAEGTLERSVCGRVIERVSQGELLAEGSAFLTRGTYANTLRAKGPATVRMFDRTQLDHLLTHHETAHDALLEDILSVLAHRAVASGKRVARLAEGAQGKPERSAQAAGPGDMAPQAEALFTSYAAPLALRQLPPLAEAGDRQVEAISRVMRSHTLQEGETLFLEGDTHRSVFLLANGRLRLLRNVGSHKAFPVTTLGTGALFGMLGLLLGTPRNASVVAEGPCWLLEMDLAAYRSLTGDIGRLWRKTLLTALNQVIEQSNRNVARLEARRLDRIRRQFATPDAMRVIAPTLTPPRQAPDPGIRTKAEQILRVLTPHRRLLPGHHHCRRDMCPDCMAPHLDRVMQFVANNHPIHFVLPAFPAKSPNTASKVLGKLPDMAEEQALRRLQWVCEHIGKIYEPGAQITICSDGRVFSDLVMADDEEVSAYRRGIDHLIARLGTNRLNTLHHEDLFKESSFEEMRDHLAVHYAESLETLKARTHSVDQDRSLFQGIHRLLFEDTVAMFPERNRTGVRRECAERACQLMVRSNAWTRLVGECFPHAIHLSIYPQHPHADRVGILLGHAEDCWLTPWHATAVKIGDAFRLMKRSQAEAMGAVLVEVDGRPNHFRLEHTHHPDARGA